MVWGFGAFDFVLRLRKTGGRAIALWIGGFQSGRGVVPTPESEGPKRIESHTESSDRIRLVWGLRVSKTLNPRP